MAGELGADGRFTVGGGGVSLNDMEQCSVPCFTSLLWVLQYLLYNLATFLEGADVVEFAPLEVAVVTGLGRISVGSESLWVSELEFPDRSSLDSSLLQSTPGRVPLKLSLLAIVTGSQATVD